MRGREGSGKGGGRGREGREGKVREGGGREVERKGTKEGVRE